MDTSDPYKTMVGAGWLEIARLEVELALSREAVEKSRTEASVLRARLADPIEVLRLIGRALLSSITRVHRGGSSQDHSVDQLWADHPDYAKWVAENDTPTVADRLAMRRHMLAFAQFPLISVVMPSYNPPERFFREALDSVCRQIYPFWELCVADDASSPYVSEILRDYAARDARIKWMRRDRNGHIAAATNSALALADGVFVALMDHDDILPDRALYEVAAEINRYPEADLIFSDEDHIDETGRRSNAYFKSDWNAELMLGQNCVSHLGVYRRSLIEQVGGMREGYEGSQDHDLALRVADATERVRIRHIPAVLYHWRQNSGEVSFSEASLERCAATSRQAVADHLRRRGSEGIVERTKGPSAWQRVRRPVPEPEPLVSLIIVTKDQTELLDRCLAGILQRTSYPNIEILIVHCDNGDTAMRSERPTDARVRELSYIGSFNISAMTNIAAQNAAGAIIGFVSYGIDVIEPTWLSEMVSNVVRADVGAVGAKLLYSDETVRHAGVLIGHGGAAGRFGQMRKRDDLGYMGRGELSSEVSAVTAACMLVRQSVYAEVGGFDEVNLPLKYYDVDFCLKLRARGYINIFTPFAELYDLVPENREIDLDPGTKDEFCAASMFVKARWNITSMLDPYYNPNLTLSGPAFKLAFPSRKKAPWERYL